MVLAKFTFSFSALWTDRFFSVSSSRFVGEIFPLSFSLSVVKVAVCITLFTMYLISG